MDLSRVQFHAGGYAFPRLAARFRQHLSGYGLGVKLLVIVVGVSLIGVAASAILILSLQQQQLIATTQSAVARLSRVVNASLEHAMLNNDRVALSQTVSSIASTPGAMERVRILDGEGVVRVSSSPSEVSHRYSQTDSSCQFCHATVAPPASQTTIARTSADQPVLLNVSVIRNRSQCEGCHDPESRVLGILMIETPLTELNDQMAAAFWRIGLGSLLTLALLVGLMFIALRKLVMQPVNTLKHGMTAIRAGNLDLAVAPSSRDELGELAATFDTMRQQLKSTALENARLLAETRHLATLEERDRLARELHDNLAQMLAFLNAKVAVTKYLMSNHDLEGAYVNLLELEQITGETYAEVREAIFSLRTIAASEWQLLPTLREYLDEYHKHYAIDTQLILADDSCCTMDGEAQVQINRIVQEALTNVRKHSGASRVAVRFERVDHSIRVSIEDNGRGFDSSTLDAQGSDHFGLQIMRDRAASVGARLDVDSQQNAGTRVTVHVPLLDVKDGAA